VNVTAADAPLLHAEPATLAFGVVRPGTTVTASVRLSDAGGGAGTWSVSGASGLPSTVTVPGTLDVRYVTQAVADGDDEFFIALSRNGVTRRIPVWVGVATPRLPRPSATLARTGTYAGSTIGRPSRVTAYRYPETSTPLGGPEQVFRVRVARAVSNFGVAVLSGSVQPRIVRAGDENRLLGQTALPINLNPYLRQFRAATPAAGALRPAPGTYDVVFDGPSLGTAGAFRFRYWVNDTRPPRLRLVTRSVARGTQLRVRATDAGAGVDPRTVVAQVDRGQVATKLENGVLRLDTGNLARGRHQLVLQVSDYQESRNMENATAILPNTARLTTSFVVR
jgi:hypothetical protein